VSADSDGGTPGPAGVPVLTQTDPYSNSVDREGFWEMEATDVHGIERALEALRKQYASPQAMAEGHAGTRNSVANLVIYAGSDEDAAEATAAVSQLAGRHPSRTILLIAGLAPGTPQVKASVSAACQLDGSRQICYEEIRLHASGRSGPHLRSIIDPLLISDLPVFLWWTGDPPFQDAVFRTLAGLSNRVLVDSAVFRSPGATLARLGRFMQDDAIDASVGDLNWNRLGSWRELLAQLFDPAATAALLPHVRRVRLERASSDDQGAASPAQSLLLAGWLASRLDWETGAAAERTYAGAYRMRLRNRGRDVLVELRDEPKNGAQPGDLQSLQLELEEGARSATFTIARAPDQAHARTSVTIDGSPAQERTVRLESAGVAVLLAGEIEDLDPDRTFKEAAQMAGRLAALLPGR